MLRQGDQPESGDLVTPGEAIKVPFVLEFLDLKDPYAESDLEEGQATQAEGPCNGTRKVRP